MKAELTMNTVKSIIILAVPSLLIFLISACGHRQEKDTRMKEIKSDVRYLALGDSYTIGEGVPQPDRWPVQLSDSLEADMGREIEVRIIAKTGWTTDELMEGIREENPKGPFDMVSLLIGVNNQYRGLDTGEYRKDFRELLELAITFAGESPSNVLVLSIPDWGVTPFARERDRQAISDEIDAFNRINREETVKAGSFYCDITPLSRQYADLVAPDSLHPSGRMYSIWASKVLPPAKKIMHKTREN